MGDRWKGEPNLVGDAPRSRRIAAGEPDPLARASTELCVDGLPHRTCRNPLAGSLFEQWVEYPAGLIGQRGGDAEVLRRRDTGAGAVRIPLMGRHDFGV